MKTDDRRALRLGALAVGAALLALRAAPAIAGAVVGLRDRVRIESALLSKARFEIATEPSLRDSAVAGRQDLEALAGVILSGRSDAEVWPDLNGRISLAARKNAATVRQSRSLGDTVEIGLLRRVTAEVELESDLRGIVATMRDLERDTIALLIVEAEIVAADPRTPASSPEIVRARLRIQSWFATERTSAGR